MVDRQGLFDKFLSFLESDPAVPEYLDQEPQSVSAFDPYQMVTEWIALRHEVKQQGKLLQAAQNTLQQGLNQAEAEKAALQQQLQDSQSQQSTLPEQKALWRDLISVLDTLDQACAHWQGQIEALDQTQGPMPSPPSCWQRWMKKWQQWMKKQIAPSQSSQAKSASKSTLRDILVSNQEGVALIRRSLLDILRQRQVIPISAKGHPFNPKTMCALGRQETTDFPENSVVQEVVRGYLWGEQVLREAQVIVATRKR
ncbi:MAG: nucleotide exchange factor GrpE [Leptolyngbyaceae cyanobacterium]